MACNGYGHPANCHCGWGGEFHAPSNISFANDYWQKKSSHTIPNAKCRVCGDRVFFYRSPDGGSVYFDELGPPWPKHQCTDNKKIGSELKVSRNFVTNNKSGWQPFLFTHILSLPSNEGALLLDTINEKILFIKTKPIYFHSTPIWISKKTSRKGEYKLSILKTKNGKTYEATFAAYTNKAFSNENIVLMFPKTIEFFFEHLQQSKNS